MSLVVHFVGGPMDEQVHAINSHAAAFEVARSRYDWQAYWGASETEPIIDDDRGLYERVGDLMLWTGWR